MQYKDLDDKEQSYPVLDGILSTSIISSDSVAPVKRKPRLAGQGFKVAEDDSTTREEFAPPSLAYSAINDNSLGLLGAESAMNYQSSGFVKIPRSLDAHPAFKQANAKYRYIFQELLKRAAWAPTCFYWNGTKIDIQVGQLYFSRKSLSEELNGVGEKNGWITENDIRGAIRYFLKVNFLTSGLTGGLTNGPMIVTILYSEFSEEEKSLTNQQSNQQSNQRLTSASPTKEEDKEDKEERKKEKKKAAKPLVCSAAASRLFSLFAADLKKRLPSAKIPANPSAWQREFEILLREQSEENIATAISGLTSHWYSSNIQSAKKLRECFSRIDPQNLPIASAKIVQAKDDKSLIIKIKERVPEDYTVRKQFGDLEITNPQGYASKFAIDDLIGINRYLSDRGWPKI